ncbi:MAG TPA: FHA domain-containing protein [Microbacteriaceae bacterium]|nr:FHA domain-containing protein [Microbacteriaceae bacterium]
MNSPEHVSQTTHAEWGAGRPRLLWHAGMARKEVALGDIVTRIGSAPDSEVWVPGLEETHAIIRHAENDEYILTLYGRGETSTYADPDANGHPRDVILRTGSQLRIGAHEFVFQRDERADHGRPHGGREGGELEVQPAQPRRPDYAAGESPHEVDAIERQES